VVGVAGKWAGAGPSRPPARVNTTAVTDPHHELARELAAIRHLLVDHEARLWPVDRDHLPRPTGHLDRDGAGMHGARWDVDGWTILCPDNEPDRDGCVYVHTPHSMRGADNDIDVVAVRYTDARLLAVSLLAALARAEPAPGVTRLPARPEEPR
jgi:hypothetical protein